MTKARAQARDAIAAWTLHHTVARALVSTSGRKSASFVDPQPAECGPLSGQNAEVGGCPTQKLV